MWCNCNFDIVLYTWYEHLDNMYVLQLSKRNVLIEIVFYFQFIFVCIILYSSFQVHKILKLCPNLEVLDLTHTNVGDAAFKEWVVEYNIIYIIFLYRTYLFLFYCIYMFDTNQISISSVIVLNLSGSRNKL